MLAPQSLRRPANWQDFESLCKKLWGEIWNCPEIKKNGRAGQAQHGVDISGTPYGEQSYYGIQCKGKDEYTDKQFTETEITTEIAKAKLFEPPLRKLYFATTALKDAKIEAYVRQKNLENQTNGIFEVHLYSWEDIVDLIDENKATAAWYISNQNYKADYKAELLFANGEREITLEPQFRQERTIYRLPLPKINLGLGLNNFDFMLKAASAMNPYIAQPMLARTDFGRAKTNLSFVPIELFVHNTGTEALEDYKVYLSFEGETTELSKKNKTETLTALMVNKNYTPTTYVYNEDKSVTLVPRRPVLVHDDHFIPETFYIKPAIDCVLITLNYRLLSRHVKVEDTLKIHVRPSIKYKNTVIEVNNEDEERTEYGVSEDYIEISDNI